jgi:hypothetical protein
MNWDRAAGDWKQLKGKVKQKWAKLTDDDLTMSTASATSCWAGFRSATASPRTRRKNSSRSGKRTSDRRSASWSVPTI